RSAEAEALTYLGVRAAFAGESAKSVILIQEALDRWNESGESPRHDQIGRTLAYLGIARLMRGEYEQAASHLTAALAVFRESGDERNLGGIHIILAHTVLQLEDPAAAAELVREGIAVSVNLQDFHLLTLAVEIALLLVGERVELDGRARLLGARDTWRRVTGSPEGGVAQLSGERLIGLRERLEVEGFGAAYVEGRTLSFQDVASLTLELLEQSFGPIATSEVAAERQVFPLSEREHEVLRQVAHGLSDKQIARELAIGERTVRRHLSSILNKLGAVNRPQAVAIAAKRGLI
ncbi:MAG TPA: LuxR C-terminal-related transcriptional regulator, partial [Chloroflexota bacterium]